MIYIYVWGQNSSNMFWIYFVLLQGISAGEEEKRSQDSKLMPVSIKSVMRSWTWNREMTHFVIVWPQGKNLLVLEFQLKYKVASFHSPLPSNSSSDLGWQDPDKVVQPVEYLRRSIDFKKLVCPFLSGRRNKSLVKIKPLGWKLWQPAFSMTKLLS